MKKIQDPGYAAREDAAAFAAHPLLAIRDSPIARADCDGDDFIKAKVLADQAWIHPIEDGIRHLKEVGGTCGCGPRACCRISKFVSISIIHIIVCMNEHSLTDLNLEGCSWEAAVHFCNDNDFPFAYSCYDLGAWFLQHLNNHCRQTGAFGIKYCGGRVWPKGGSWTLTLQRDQCW